MANNEGYVEVIAKIKPANRTGFKVADSSDIEYPIDGRMNEKRTEENKVTNTNAAIDALYDIISATPTFWLVDNSKLTSDGSARLNISIGTSSPQGSTVKLTITNTTTGAIQTMSGLPINSIHNIDLGIISTFGTYNYTVTAVDNYNNAMVVDKTKSSSGSYVDETGDQYQLKFSVVAGSTKLTMGAIDRVDNTGAVISINNKTNIYTANLTNDIDSIKTNIRVRGTIQYPEVSGSGVSITHAVEYNIYGREMYIKTNKGEYISVYKYNALKDRGLTPYGAINYTDLYYKYAISTTDDSYVKISDYDLLESDYNLKSEDEYVGVFYNFVKNANGDGEFIKNGTGENDYELRLTNVDTDTYDFIPSFIPADVCDLNGNLYPNHNKLTENIQFTIADAYFLNEGKYRIACKAIVNKVTNIEGQDPIVESPAESMIMYSNIYPINDDFTEPNALRIIPIENVSSNATTDDNINISFMIISSKSNVLKNIKFTASLYYRPDGTTGSDDIVIKEIIREGCDNLKEQLWNIGRVTKGRGHYYYRIYPQSYDGSVNGTEYIYHFNVKSGATATTQYSTDGLVAYWDAQRMSNDMKNPDIWYPISIQGADDNREEAETHDYYIKLHGLNFNTNGWVEYDENTNKHPHLKFTGDSYGLAYRLDSSGVENPLSVMDLMNHERIPAWSNDTSDKEMSFEIMFRTRCVGEMKACVLSSRIEESNTLPLYTYSDTDAQIANPGITISYNKAIINSDKSYVCTPYNQDEWKHIVFVINKNENHTMVAENSIVNYNPFASMRIYVNGVLTTLKDIPINKNNSNEFNQYIQMVLNGHLDTGSVKNFGTSEIRLIRMYNTALSNDQVVSNYISSIYDLEDRAVIERKNSNVINTVPVIYFVRNSNGEDASIDNIRKKNTKNTTFKYLTQITDKVESKEYFVNCTMYYAYPNPENAQEMLRVTHNNVDVYLQGTSTLQFPVKNLKIRTYTDATEPDPNDPTKTILKEVGGKKDAKSFKFLPPNMSSEWVADSTYTLKCDYMESGHLNNTPTAKFYHNVVGELINSRIDSGNGNVRPLNMKEYRYEQNNVSGTHYLDTDGKYKKVIDDYKGTKYSQIEVTEKNSASPSRDYYEPVKLSDGTIHYTSAIDAYEEFGHIHRIDKNTGLIDESIIESEDNKIVHYYEEPNSYYIRKYDSSYSSLKWELYDPTNSSHYGYILYKLNPKYRDSIDGFPCIVYYTDTYMGYTNDAGAAQAKGDLTLLGTMMFNIDKTGKSIGFEIDPVYENEYDEYLYSQYIENDIESNHNMTFAKFRAAWFGGQLSSYNNRILSFNDFYNSNEGIGFTFKETSIDEVSNATNNFNNTTEEPYYGIIDDNYVKYFDMTETERNSVTEWYIKEVSDDYGTIPAYTYDQQYIESSNGEYKYDTISEKYVLADASYTGTRYKLIFNDYRTYHINKNNGSNIRLGTQCALSYEATTNTKYAAGTFYDVDEAYNQTYEDDFINQYHNKYFVKTDGVTPMYIEDYKGDSISPVIKNNIDTAITIEEFKSLLNSSYNMSAIDLSVWNNSNNTKQFFYIDKNEAGPYVYIYNGSPALYSADTSDGQFVIYDRSIHGNISSDRRYKFALPFKSCGISYEVDSNGTYCYDDSIDGYRKIAEGESVSTKYKQVYDVANVITFTINDKRSYVADKLSGDDKSYLKYVSESFEPRYSYVDENDNVKDNIEDEDKGSYLAMKNLIKWIVESVKDTDDLSSTDSGTNRFREEFRKHFDLTYAITYYLQMIVFAQADNAGKNSMWDTWDGKKFYIRPYDMDTQSGLNNKGLFNVPTSAEVNIAQSPRQFTDNTSTKLGQISNWYTDGDHIRYTAYTTSTSRFWNAFAKAFDVEIKNAYGILRNSGIYTADYIINFYKANSTDIIGEKYYNADMNAKYLSQGDEVAMGEGKAKLDYLALLMGNRLDQFSKWIAERLIFCDTYFNYIENDTLNTQLDIRAQTTNSTAAIGISVFSPQYVKISVGSTRDAVFTAFVDTNSTYTLNGIQYEGTLFTLPITGNNKEISIYGGGNIKEIVNIGDLKASTLNLGNAKKIIKLEISGNSYIESLNLANATYLRELNVSNCNKLVGNLDVSNSINLHTLDISKSALSGVSLAPGGNLKSFIATDTSISTIDFNDLQQLTDIRISNSTGIAPVTSYILRGCPLIKSLNLDSFINLNKLEVYNCKALTSISIENNMTLTDLSINKCDNLSILNLKGCRGNVLQNLNLSTAYGLDILNINECKSGDNPIHITFPFFKNDEVSNDPNINVDNAEYKHRWHNLKALRCEKSDIAVISYGENDTNSDTIDMSPLNMITGTPKFYRCEKIKNIKGLKFNGNLSNIFSESTIETISDSSLELSGNNLSSLFYNCKQIRNFQTLNIEPYTKGHSGSLSLDSIFYSSYATNAMLNKMIASGREYTLTKVTNKNTLPTSSSSYDCQDYLVRDTMPRYKITTITDDALYVYDEILGEYRLYNNITDKDSITYYKYNSTYYPNKFGLYISTEIDSSGNTGYISVNTDNVIDLTESQTYSNYNINGLSSSYNVEGTIARKYNGTQYYIYFNNKWRSSKIYTFYNANEEGLQGTLEDGTKFYIGSLGHELYEDTFYSDNSDANLSTSNRSNRYYRVYNPDVDKDTDITVYKKNYVTTPGSNYISSISSIYCSANGSAVIDSSTFNGLDKCTNASYAFYASQVYQPDRNNFSIAFKKLKSLTNTSGMFAYCTRLTSLPSDMFTNCTNLKTATGMFRGCTALQGFYTSGGNLYYDNVLPRSLTNIDSIFKGCSSLTMNSDNLNKLLVGLSNVTTSQSAFEGCTKIYAMRNEPLKDMTSVENISSMFASCTNLKAQIEDPDDSTKTINYMPMTPEADKAFRLFSLDSDKEYVVKNANSLFYGCTALTGFIDRYFFGNAQSITLLGCDYAKTNEPFTGANILNRGGAFCNTSIYSYHEDFLSKLTNLKDVSCLFAKTNGNSIDPQSSLNLKMYGYISTQSDGTYKINAGISPNIFINNKQLEDVSYVFAGNHGLERYSDSIDTFQGNITLPNIFRNCPNIKYMIGTFMGTTMHPTQYSQHKENTSSYITYNKIYKKGSSGTEPNAALVNIDEFFKVLDDNGTYETSNREKMSGMKNLLSVESLFENSNYTVYDNLNKEAKLSSETFKDCTKLSSTKCMFKNNIYLSGNNIIPIDLFNPCRKTISDVSGMFQGCENIHGTLPIGDNTILIAYNNYIDDIKNDPDVLDVYPKIATLTIGQIFDNILKGLYPEKIVRNYDDNGFTYDKILTFDEFKDKYSNVRYRVNKTMDFGKFNATATLKPIITVHNDNNPNECTKYTNYTFKVDDGPIDIMYINTVYLKDRVKKKVVESDVGQKKIVNEKLVTITLSDKGKEVDFALFGEIGTYGIKYDRKIDNSIIINDHEYILSEMSNSKLNYPNSFDTLIELGSSYDTSVGKFVRRTCINTMVSVPNSYDIDNGYLNKLQLINIYKLKVSGSNNEREYIPELDESGYLNASCRNRRIIPIDLKSDDITKTKLVKYTDFSVGGKLSFVINGPILEEYSIDEELNNTTRYCIDTSMPIDGTEDIATIYNCGLLGSCPQLSNASSMFAGCINLKGSIPMDLFSAESPNTYLNSLIDISSMFRGSYLLSTVDENGDYANPQTMYYRDPDSLLLVKNGEYLVPEDWLKYAPNIQDVSYLFSRVATISTNQTYMAKPPSGNNPSDNNISIKETYIGGIDGLILPDIFSGKSRISNASYLIYGSPLITGVFSNQFLRDSIGNLTNIKCIFAHSSITSIGTESTIRIFETANINSKLTNVEAAFFGCSYLTSESSFVPRFYLSTKFSKISNYKYVYCGTYLLKNMSDSDKEKLMTKDYYTSDGSYNYYSSMGYNTVSISYNTLFMNLITS